MKLTLIKTVFIGIITLAVFSVASTVSATSLPVTGWAWSFMPTGANEKNQNYNPGRPDKNVGQGGGGISMDNGTGGGSVVYGVTVDDATGNFGGYAWNSYLGYVDFSGAKVSNPACLVDGTGTSPVTGTIKFISAGQPQSGGWDGVVSMNGAWTSPVVVDCATGTLSGYGWGNYVVGWVDFEWVKITKNPDVCPDNSQYPATIGNQTTVPVGFQKINGQCVPDTNNCPVGSYRYNGQCFDNQCIAQDGTNDFAYFNNGDPTPNVCLPPPPLCTDEPCPSGTGDGIKPIYKEN